MDKELRQLLSLVALVIIMANMPLAAQAALVKPAAATRISLITILPGRSLYSAFGHSAIRLVDPKTGTDVLYNYGLSARPFDVRFVLGMLVGRMEFMVAALDTETAFGFYKEAENRTIIEQELRLDGDTTSALIAALKRDTLPENRVYCYRYFTDNCATRVWKLLLPLLVTDPIDAIGFQEWNLRDSIRRALKDNPWLSSGLDILLGPMADRQHIGDTLIFLPQQLMQAVAKATISSDGGQSSLVISTATRYQSTWMTGRNSRLAPVAAGIVFLLLSAVFMLKPLSRSALVFDIIFFAGLAIVGLTIIMIWMAAGYPEAGFNLNLLWANPLPLIAMIAVHARRSSGMSARILGVLTVVAGVLAVGGGLGIQAISPEARLFAASVALRCIQRGGYFMPLGISASQPI